MDLEQASAAEPFVDVEDIADVAVTALLEDGHAGQVYELTGPRLLTFAQAVEEIAEVTGRKVEFVQIPKDTFVSTLAAQGVPDEVVKLITYLLTTVLDGRNAHLTDGVQRALGRQPRDFTEYVQQTAAAGAWYA